eukprot:TRINITY_DN1869_c0_g1_i2.p1 TRINITY_DN1869_c0_g1~~TRINITY_DN1869_c0_g1_i2.p1  ORF type:complete len:141 (-),score=18.20 TRINITY_DN1869_c0_g1_i2:51-473(-)
MQLYVFDDADVEILVGSYGAGAVLLYAAPTSPLAQPRNTIGGYLVSSIVGVTIYKVMEHFQHRLLTAALAVSLSIVAMHFTGTLHPPGAATSLLAVVGSQTLRNQGYLYCPIVLFGACVMIGIALIVNNIPKAQRYPLYW